MSFTSARRDLVLVAGAKAVSFLGDEVAMIALMLRLQSDGAGASAVAALLIANLLPILILSGLVGRLIDRVDSRRLLLTSSLTQAAVCGTLVFVTPTPAVLALVALLGAGQAVNGATWQALLPAIVAPDGLPRAVSVTHMCTTAANIAAPALGGLLTGLYGARVPLVVDAASFLAVTAAALLLRTRTERAPATAERQHGGFTIVRRDALLRPLFALLAVFVLLGSMVNVVDVFLVREALGASATWYGVIGAAFAVGMLPGAFLAGRLAGFPQLARCFVAACVLLGLGLAGMGLTPSIAVALPVMVATGFGNGLVNVTLGALVMGRAAAVQRGRVAAMLSGTASATQLLAYAAGGVLSGALGPREVFVLAGCLGLAAPALLGRGLVRAADLAACPTNPPQPSPPSGGASLPPAASPTLSPAT